jgi:hypothetical protein
MSGSTPALSIIVPTGSASVAANIARQPLRTATHSGSIEVVLVVDADDPRASPSERRPLSDPRRRSAGQTMGT